MKAVRNRVASKPHLIFKTSTPYKYDAQSNPIKNSPIKVLSGALLFTRKQRFNDFE